MVVAEIGATVDILCANVSPSGLYFKSEGWNGHMGLIGSVLLFLHCLAQSRPGSTETVRVTPHKEEY